MCEIFDSRKNQHNALLVTHVLYDLCAKKCLHKVQRGGTTVAHRQLQRTVIPVAEQHLFLAVCKALCEKGDIADAERCLSQACGLLPEDEEIQREYARHVQLRLAYEQGNSAFSVGDFEQALVRLSSVAWALCVSFP